MSLLPVVPPMHECTEPPAEEKVSLTNLCNRSVVTSTLGNPRSRAQGSHPADHRFRGRPFSPACFAGAGTILSVHGGVERPRGPFDLEWRRAWHRSRQLEPVFNLPPSGPWPGLLVLRGVPHTRLVRPCTRWLTRLLTLPVAPPSLPDLRWPSGFLTEPRTRSTDGKPMPPLSELEASSTAESRTRCSFAGAQERAWSRHESTGFATGGPLPTRVRPLAAG